MAAPHVAGALAVLKSHYPEYSASILNNVLSQEGSNQWTDCNFHGYGYFTDDNDPYSEPLLYVKNIQ
jgi:subtilisin family serine protease